MPSYRYEVLVQGKWYDNKVFFATEEEARKAASEKFQSWTLVDDTCVIKSDEPVNYRFEDGKLIHIATTD